MPLVAPEHPLVIPSKLGSNYYKGVHDQVYSIALPIPADDLLLSETFIQFYEKLKNSSFAHKLSWETFDRRKNKLHATVCGALSVGQEPFIHERVYGELRGLGPVGVNICGMFSGNINIGRLYLKVYPELRDGKNMCHAIQTIFGAPLTNLYVVGLLNFVEELDIDETRELQEFLGQWRKCEFVQLSLENLWLIQSRDDLVLNGSIAKNIPLV